MAAIQVVCSEPEHCQIRERVGAYNREVEIATIGERRAPPRVASGNNVRGGQDEAVGCDHDPASSTVEYPPATNWTKDTQACHRRRQLSRDRDNHARVRVKRRLDRRLLSAGFLRGGDVPGNELDVGHETTVAIGVRPTSDADLPHGYGRTCSSSSASGPCSTASAGFDSSRAAAISAPAAAIPAST